MRSRILLRTLRYVAYNWSIPLLFGLTVGALANLSGMAWLSISLLDACRMGQGA